MKPRSPRWNLPNPYSSASLDERAGFEIFMTMNAGLEYQQNLAGRSIAILILRDKSNRLADLLPLAPAIDAVISPCARQFHGSFHGSQELWRRRSEPRR